jgi:hypothetical protein
MPLTASFVSSEQTITNSADNSVAHGLGRLPTLVQAILRCKTAELGYSVGEEVILPDASDSAAGARGYSVYANTTNIGFVSMNNPIALASRSSLGTYGIITNANWKLVFKAW